MTTPPAAAPAARMVAHGPGKVNRTAVPQFQVVDVTFANSIDIWYARIPVSGGKVGWLRPAPASSATVGAAPAEKPADHLTPAAVRPVAGQPHYKSWPGKPSESWPVAYVRGPGANPAGDRKLTATFRCLTSATSGSFDVTGSAPGIKTDKQTVSFANGIGSATFTLTSVPATVARVDGGIISWTLRPSGARQGGALCRSRHTFYFVDGAPLQPLGGPESEQFFFELFDWSCRWARGNKGKALVIAAIWRQFSPIHDPHDSGLIYWRNWSLAVSPAQTMPDAIRCVDPGSGLGQFAVSCKVFDRMFMNSLALHGIETSEVIIVPHAGFTSAGVVYRKPAGWNIASGAAQGNADGPPRWSNHWISDANNGTTWELYDPSYGASQSPWAASPPVHGTITPPAAYETGAGVNFDATPTTGGPSVKFKSANPNDPRLDGLIQYAN